MNAGYASVSLIGYYVKDVNGSTYANSSWTGPSAAPNARVQISIVIDGKTFSFQHGYNYTINLITSRNDQFAFTISA